MSGTCARRHRPPHPAGRERGRMEEPVAASSPQRTPARGRTARANPCSQSSRWRRSSAMPRGLSACPGVPGKERSPASGGAVRRGPRRRSAGACGGHSGLIAFESSFSVHSGDAIGPATAGSPSWGSDSASRVWRRATSTSTIRAGRRSRDAFVSVRLGGTLEGNRALAPWELGLVPAPPRGNGESVP